MKKDYNFGLTGDDLLTVQKSGIGNKVFFTVISRGGKPPETLDVSWRLAAAWNAMQGLSNAALAEIKPGAIKALVGDALEPVVIDVDDYKVVETTS